MNAGGVDPAIAGLSRIESWFESKGWRAFEYQREAWSAYLSGLSGLVHAPTGFGKSLAAWMGPVAEGLEAARTDSAGAARCATLRRDEAAALRVLWITPMRALANDTVQSLRVPIDELGLNWTVELRTGDTPQSLRAKQRERLPTALVTTPESLSLLLSFAWAREALGSVRCVVVDEWHELMSTKRGTQTELCLAHLRGRSPGLRVWGLSATLGNLDEALGALLGSSARARGGACGAMISADLSKEVRIESILPSSMERFPWAGHLGLSLLKQTLEVVERGRSTLLFTNTRSQAELWFRAVLQARPEWAEQVAIHHGSIEREIRERVEEMLREGALRCVVCTSSLDLGVDFSPVDQVIQVGSPKGIARLMQRAGRSGHQPGALSKVYCVPTNAMELVEFSAARVAARARRIESRRPLERPLDVLVQHIVTLGVGGSVDPAGLLEEVRGAWSYAALSDEEWAWCVDHVTRGGPALGAYPEYARLSREEGGLRCVSRVIERMHRLNIGTISSEQSIRVRYRQGSALGTIEESFVSRLKPGDTFVFAGRPLRLVRVHEMTAIVERARSLRGAVPRWDGGRTPLSTQLSEVVRSRLARHRGDAPEDEEMACVSPVLELQSSWSVVPREDELLIERVKTRDGHHVFLYPFEGRLAHEGLGALMAHRLIRARARSVSVTSNDYGIELLSETELPGADESAWRGLLSRERLVEDLLECVNSTELTRRQFRDIARVAGLVSPGLPGAGKSSRHLQASSALFFDVFSEFDPGNRLLEQARREVLEQQLEVARLREALERLAGQKMNFVELSRLSPLSFGLWAEGLRTQQVSSETWSDRVKKMAVMLEEEAGGRADDRH